MNSLKKIQHATTQCGKDHLKAIYNSKESESMILKLFPTCTEKVNPNDHNSAKFKENSK